MAKAVGDGRGMIAFVEVVLIDATRVDIRFWSPELFDITPLPAGLQGDVFPFSQSEGPQEKTEQSEEITLTIKGKCKTAVFEHDPASIAAGGGAHRLDESTKHLNALVESIRALAQRKKELQGYRESNLLRGHELDEELELTKNAENKAVNALLEAAGSSYRYS